MTAIASFLRDPDAGAMPLPSGSRAQGSLKVERKHRLRQSDLSVRSRAVVQGRWPKDGASNRRKGASWHAFSMYVRNPISRSITIRGPSGSGKRLAPAHVVIPSDSDRRAAQRQRLPKFAAHGTLEPRSYANTP